MVNGALPDSWVVKRLIDVGRLLRGVSYRKEDSSESPKRGLVPILRATNIQNEKLILDDELVYVPSEYVKPEQYLKPNDIVVCMSSGSKHLVGKTAQLAQEWKGSFGTFCAAIRPSDNVNSRFVGYFFSSPYYRDFIREKSAGININNLKPTDFETIEIPVPPLPEQERIVAKIEELFTQLEAGTSALERVQAGLRRYKASVLKAAVEGRLVGADGIRPSGRTPSARTGELPEGWRWTTVGEIADHRLGKMLDKEKNTGQPRPYLRNINVRWFRFDFFDIQEMRVLDDELENISIQKGDLIVCEGGEPGRAAVWNKDETMVIQKALHRVRTKEDVLSSYLMYYLAADASNGKLEKYFTGSTIKHFTGQSLKVYKFALPPLEEQRQIVAEVERRLSVARQVESSVEDGLARAARLRQAVLRSAFEGKLT